jgi:tetratricopeptide (TPR) repeat protein
MARSDLGYLYLSRGEWGPARAFADDIDDAIELKSTLRALEAFVRGDLQAARDTLPPKAAGGWLVPYLHALWASHAACILEAQTQHDAAVEVADVLDQLLVGPGVGVWRIVMHGATPDSALLAALLPEQVSRREFDYLCRVAPIRSMYGSIDRARGSFALAIGLDDEAERWFELGRELCERVGFVLDEGQCLLGLAEVAERRGDHARALEFLDRAGERFAGIGAKYFLDKVIAQKEILKA